MNYGDDVSPQILEHCGDQVNFTIHFYGDQHSFPSLCKFSLYLAKICEQHISAKYLLQNRKIMKLLFSDGEDIRVLIWVSLDRYLSKYYC